MLNFPKAQYWPELKSHLQLNHHDAICSLCSFTSSCKRLFLNLLLDISLLILFLVVGPLRQGGCHLTNFPLSLMTLVIWDKSITAE